jgi:hypothetical protein
VTDPRADGAYQRLAGAGRTSGFGAQQAVPGRHGPVRGPAFGPHVVIVARVQNCRHGWGAVGDRAEKGAYDEELSARNEL